MWNEEAQKFILSLEYSLTIALRRSSGVLEGPPVACDCVDYLINRKTVLIPEILKQSKKTGEDADLIFHRFQKGVHTRHEIAEASA